MGIVTGDGGDAASLAVALAVGDPFSPFVVGDEGGDYEDDGDEGEEELHKKSD
jgi:hypothetical protein